MWQLVFVNGQPDIFWIMPVRVSHVLAKQIAEQEYETFNQLRIEMADQQAGEFEKVLQRIPGNRNKK